MGRITLFRPEQNALRMQMGADRLCMTPPSVDQFVEAVKQTVIANKKWVWPSGGSRTIYSWGHNTKNKAKNYELRAQICLFTKLKQLNQISLSC